MTGKIHITWDCGHGCPPIHVDLPVRHVPNGEIATCEIGTDRLRRTVDVHMLAVHS